MAESGFSRPNLPSLIATIRSDLLTRMNNDGLLRRLDAEVYARVQAAAVDTLYGYIDYLARNMLPDLADEQWLARHGRLKRCPRKPASAASGFVRWDGVTKVITLPAGTVLTRDDQAEFITTEDTNTNGGVLRAPVLASVAGVAGNTDDGIALRLATPVSGLSSTGTADTIAGGTDTEPLEEWRARIMERWYYTPQGGADADYIIWSKEIPGITRAWTKRNWQGPGTVGVMIATSDPDHPAPGEEMITAVRDHILPLAPVAGAGLFVFPVTEKTVPFTIALAKDTPAIRNAVIAELKSYFLRDGEPSGTLYWSRISEAVSIANEELAHRISVPSDDIKLGETELPVLGEINWEVYTPITG